jgi:hypothetical protein
MATTRSSIAIALNGSMVNARDIPKPFGSDAFTSGLAKSVPSTKVARPLPTPPNSISPNLPPHSLKARVSAATPMSLDTVESDLDLQDGSGGSMGSQHGFETAGSITPSLLAKHHLPDILLNDGPLAIRHIMGYLTTSVPGFSSIPPAKARRLVVGALEGRGSGGEGGGLNGDVKFEKVGWGRWDARLKGQSAKNSRGQSPPSLPASYSVGMPIANNSAGGRSRLNNAPSSSWTGESAIFSHDDDMDMEMLETEADKMSLDGGDESCSSSEGPPEDELMGDDPEDMTDDEDWAAVGAVALRQASYNSAALGNRNLLSSHVYTGGSSLALAKSAPLHPNNISFQPNNQRVDFSTFGMTSDSQEREAIEALLRLGSV